MMDHYSKWFARTERLVSVKNSLKALFFAVTLLISSGLYAQERVVSGKITDAADGSGIPGTSIAIKGTTKGVVTDVNGNFKISVPAGSTIVVSSVGYLRQEIATGNKSDIDVALATDAKTIEEVVVVGYGTQKRKEISGTVTSLGSKEFNSGIITNPLAAAQGKVAGLVITQASGDPNAAPTVRLRGTGSLTAGSEPLYVIDGVIGAPIQNVAPEDIATMDVLRDASSAAIYGSRGSNGVILITTKRGKTGTPQVDFSTYVGTESISQRPNLMNADQFRQAATKYNQAFTDNGANTDWLKAITRTAHTQNYNIGISGGSENTSYRASVGYLNQIGTLIGSGKDRYNVRLNLDSKAMDGKLKMSFNISASQAQADIAQNIAIGLAMNERPTDPIYNADGSYYQIPGTFSSYNPLAIVQNRKQQEKLTDLLGNVQAAYTILDGLVFKVSGTMRTQGLNRNAFQNSFANVPIRGSSGNSGLRELNSVLDKQLETTLNYSKALGANSNFSVLGGYTYQDVTNDGLGIINNNFLTDILGANNIGSGLGIRTNPGFIGSYKNEYKLVSFLGRAQYSLADKYFVTANIRRDGSTKFGDNNKWGIFPSVSVGWALNKESFLKNIQAIDNMKLRVSWGRTGNSEGIRPLLSKSFYGPSGSYYDGASGSFLPAYAIQSNPNPNLKWEVNENYGAGLDFSLNKGKISGSVDWYTRTTKDLLYSVSAPQEKGFVYPTILANIGSMQNKGVELSLTYQWVDHKDFDFSSTLVGSFNHNKVISLANGDFAAPNQVFLPTSLGNFIRGTSAVNFAVLQVGQPVGVFYGAQVTGITDKGAYIFKDIDGDGKYDVNKDRTYIGNPTPVFVGGLTNNLRFKHFDLNFLLTSNRGASIMNTNQLLLGRQDGRVAENNALVSTLTSKVNDTQTIPMDYYVESGNFVRLNNAALGYNIPVKSGGVVHRARIYVAGNNLALWTKYTGVDPEVSQKLEIGSASPGIDVRETYYKTRAFTAGLNITF
jgi:TonB-dependent starch-binding outer membrane protein SusC